MSDVAAKQSDRARDERLKKLAEAEAQFATIGETPDPGPVTVLRVMISTYPELGAGPSGRVVAGLNGLIEMQLAAGQFDREALGVHMRAWRLILTKALDAEATDELLAGLRAVRDRYAGRKAA